MPFALDNLIRYITIALQPVVTCRQSPHLHKPAIIIILIMTSFAIELVTPSVTDKRTLRTGHLTAFNI